MNQFKLWLVVTAMACFAVTASAAPVPPPESQGPISDALRLRGKVPATVAPMATRVAMSDENTIEVERVTSQTVPVTEEVVVEKDGKQMKVVQYVTRTVPVYYKSLVAVNKCKFFTVTKDGKLEEVDTKKATGMLKKPTVVLTGDSAEVDSRHLEMVKPGTLYLVLPPPEPQQVTPPPHIPR